MNTRELLIFGLIFAGLISGCGKEIRKTEGMKDNSGRIEEICGKWIVKSVKKWGGEDVQGSKDIGKTIEISQNKFISLDKAVYEWVEYKYEVIHNPKEEGVVPSNKIKRTSAFHGYKWDRNTIQGFEIYNSEKKYIEKFEVVGNEVIIMKDNFILIFNREK